MDEQTIKKLLLPRWRWCPRPDEPGVDEQTSFLFDQTTKFIVLLGGNGSGKTEAAAVKTARNLCDLVPPPRKVSRFVIVGPSLDQVCGVCWGEKLNGKNFILETEIDWSRCSWINRRRNYPRVISLSPDRRGYRWEIHFMSVEQTRRLFQGYAIDGFWISEQIPWDIVVELYRGVRESALTGVCYYENTPIDPSLASDVREFVLNNKNAKVYKLATIKNFHVSDEWKRTFESLIPDELKATRLYGEFPETVGRVFNFDPISLIDKKPLKSPRLKVIGIDWGGGGSHPTAAVFCLVYDDGTIYVLDEFLNVANDQIISSNIIKVKERCQQLSFSPDFIVADTENRLANNELAKHFRYKPANKNLFESIDRIRFLLANSKLKLNSKCKTLLKQLQDYRFSDKAKIDVVRENNDLVDALRYVIASLPENQFNSLNYIASGYKA